MVQGLQEKVPELAKAWAGVKKESNPIRITLHQEKAEVLLKAAKKEWDREKTDKK